MGSRYFKVGQRILSKLAKDKTKTKSKAEQLFDNVYKKDPTGKKDKLIKTLNKKIKKSVTKTAGPKEIEEYHKIMTSDRQYKLDYGKKK